MLRKNNEVFDTYQKNVNAFLKKRKEEISLRLNILKGYKKIFLYIIWKDEIPLKVILFFKKYIQIWLFYVYMR